MSISTPTIQAPIEPYAVTGYRFGQRIPSRLILIARHLGDDILADPGTKVHATGNGVVVWSEMRLGTVEKRNWGGIVIIKHMHPVTGAVFYSVYGHLDQLAIHSGDQVSMGDLVGVVAHGASPENGYWKRPHLHFGIYTGPWSNKVLPGWLRPFEGRTKFSWWTNPKLFLETY